MRRRQDRTAERLEVIASLYEAATSPDAWRPALDRFYGLFDAMAAHFFLWDEVIDRPVASHASTTYAGQQDALNYYLRIDPRRVLLARQPVGSTVLCHQHFDDAFVRGNEFFQDYSLKMDRRYLMATKLQQVGATASVLALFRSPGQGSFGVEEFALFEHLRPHLEQIARLYRRRQQVTQARQVERAMLDSVPAALIATDETACVIRTNNAAAALLSAGDGLRVASGRIVAARVAQTEALHSLIRHATDAAAPAGGSMIVDRSGGERLGVAVTRLDQPAVVAVQRTRRLALVSVTSLEQNTRPDRHLIGMFGLTQAEARLAAEITAGHRLDTLASEHDVRMSTLRTQLRAIYRKTGTSRQAELVHLLASLPSLHSGA